MERTCPICGATADQNSDHCNTLNCGWQFFDLLSDSPTEKAAYEAKVKQAKADYVDCQTDIEPNLVKDVFETDQEFSERLTRRAWLAGTATLVKEDYDIETGIFKLRIKWKGWFSKNIDRGCGGLSLYENLYITVSRDIAKEMFHKRLENPVYVWIELLEKNVITAKRLQLKTVHGDVSIPCDSQKRRSDIQIENKRREEEARIQKERQIKEAIKREKIIERRKRLDKILAVINNVSFGLLVIQVAIISALYLIYPSIEARHHVSYIQFWHSLGDFWEYLKGFFVGASDVSSNWQDMWAFSLVTIYFIMSFAVLIDLLSRNDRDVNPFISILYLVFAPFVANPVFLGALSQPFYFIFGIVLFSPLLFTIYIILLSIFD